MEDKALLLNDDTAYLNEDDEMLIGDLGGEMEPFDYVSNITLSDNNKSLNIVQEHADGTQEVLTFTSPDVSDFVTSDDLNNYLSKEEAEIELNKKVNAVEGKQLSTEDFTSDEKVKLASLTNYDDTAVKERLDSIELSKALTIEEEDINNWNSKYTKPEEGISKEDLSADVTESLAKADTALQSHQSLEDYATKDFVNSSIATQTADFLGTFDSVESLPETATAKNYAYVKVNGETEEVTYYDRYKFNSEEGWKFEFRVNNTEFTSVQWAAINSGATKADIDNAKILANGSAGQVLKSTGEGIEWSNQPVIKFNNSEVVTGINFSIDSETKKLIITIE